MKSPLPSQCVSARAVDCSQVADWSRQVGWEIDYQQVGRGFFNAWFTTASCERLRFTNQFCNREIVICGSPPQDMVAVVLPSGVGPLGVYEGTALRPTDAIVLSSGDARCLRSPAGFNGCTVSVPRTTLEEAVWRYAHCEVANVFTGSQWREFTPKRMKKLASMICFLTSEESRTLGPTATVELQDRLLQQLAKEFCQGRREVEQHVRPGDRARYVRRARDYIEAHLNEAIRLNQLAAHAGVSIRTLELAFRQLLGVAPIEYIRTRRLNQLRRQLLRKGREIPTLADLAKEHGLIHMGRLSAEYRTLFGELPSETLARSQQ